MWLWRGGCVSLGWSSRPERGRFAGNADRGSAIDEQRAGTVHSTRDESHITRAAGGCPILRLRFLMRWGVTANFPEERRCRRGQRDKRK